MKKEDVNMDNKPVFLQNYLDYRIEFDSSKELFLTINPINKRIVSFPTLQRAKNFIEAHSLPLKPPKGLNVSILAFNNNRFQFGNIVEAYKAGTNICYRTTGLSYNSPSNFWITSKIGAPRLLNVKLLIEEHNSLVEDLEKMRQKKEDSARAIRNMLGNHHVSVFVTAKRNENYQEILKHNEVNQ